MRFECRTAQFYGQLYVNGIVVIAAVIEFDKAVSGDRHAFFHSPSDDKPIGIYAFG